MSILSRLFLELCVRPVVIDLDYPSFTSFLERPYWLVYSIATIGAMFTTFHSVHVLHLSGLILWGHETSLALSMPGLSHNRTLESLHGAHALAFDHQLAFGITFYFGTLGCIEPYDEVVTGIEARLNGLPLFLLRI